jgi:hypothetical protein
VSFSFSLTKFNLCFLQQITISMPLF